MLTEEMKKEIEAIVDESFASLSKSEEETTSEEEVKKSDEENTEEESSEEVKKSEEENVEDVEKSETEEESTEEEDVEKGCKSGEAPKEKTPENGGKDSMKSGTPHCESQKMMKSIEELSEFLSADEVELIAAWREENNKEEETVSKSQSGLQDSTNIDNLGEIVKSAVAEATGDLRKSIEDKDDLIKSLNEKVEKMAARPAYDKRSVDSLEPIEKSEESAPQTPSKAKILDTMLELQKSGAGITSYHVSEYEATETISDPRARDLLTDALKKA